MKDLTDKKPQRIPIPNPVSTNNLTFSKDPSKKLNSFTSSSLKSFENANPKRKMKKEKIPPTE